MSEEKELLKAHYEDKHSQITVDAFFDDIVNGFKTVEAKKFYKEVAAVQGKAFVVYIMCMPKWIFEIEFGFKKRECGCYDNG